MKQQFKAVVAFSGGQDSTTVLTECVDYYGASKVYALTADYGQSHARELNAAEDITRRLGVKHEIVKLGNILKGTSPLTNKGEKLETYKSYEEMTSIIGDRREKTFVPMRNPLFLTIAANRASVFGATEIWTGVCQMDGANYSDCTGIFVDKMEEMINEALGSDTYDNVPEVLIVTPLLQKTKAETVLMAMKSMAGFKALAWSHTAYSGEFPPVTQDHATVLRAQGFKEANVPDPLFIRANFFGLCELPKTENYAGIAPILKESTNIEECLGNAYNFVKMRVS